MSIYIFYNVFQNGYDTQSTEMSDEDAFDDEETYEVEEIRDKKRGDDGKYLYYVKWKGWESDTNTWEPYEHLEDCPLLIEEFERKRRRFQEKREKKREEREKKKQQRRERELKAAARFKAGSDSDEDYDRSSRDTKKEEKDGARKSDGASEDPSKTKKDSKRKKEEFQVSKPILSKDRKEDKNQKRPPKFFRDLKPDSILGMTADVGDGELYFYIKWKDDQAEPGLVKAKEAYQKIPMMCLSFYEKHLVWNKVTSKKDSNEVKSEKESKTNCQEFSEKASSINTSRSL